MTARRRREPPAAEPPALAWLEALEARVHDAVERLTAAAADNARLRQRVADLESRLAAAEDAGAEGADDGAAWRRERAEVRERVHRLAESLEALLEEESR